MNLSYRIVGGMSFYQREEVKDLRAYLRLLINPKDESALKRIFNFPKTGIGISSVDKMTVLATDHSIYLCFGQSCAMPPLSWAAEQAVALRNLLL
jgi:DNA helicase II / ATP-dependent DNA helicase PcrA